MSYPDYELNEPTTEMNILKMLELIYKKMNSDNVSNNLFYIKLPVNEPKNYLNYDTENESYFLSTKIEVGEYRTKFTQQEIDKMNEDSKLSFLNLEKCKVPVKEEE